MKYLKFYLSKDKDFINLKVPDDDIPENFNIYKYLKSKGFSERYLTKLRYEGLVKLNNKNAILTDKICKNDILSLHLNPNPNTSNGIMQCIIPLNIVFEDEFFLIVNKPALLATIPTKSHFSHDLAGAIMNYYKDKNFTLRILNRLDKDVSGLIVVAKNLFICNILPTFDKTYYGICNGILQNKLIVNREVLTTKTNNINNRKRIMGDYSANNQTIVEPIKVIDNNTLLKIKIKGGKTHQIRVHLSGSGYPLLGDEIYGKPHNKINHTALICKEIEFKHPITLQNMNFEVPFPQDLNLLINS